MCKQDMLQEEQDKADVYSTIYYQAQVEVETAIAANSQVVDGNNSPGKPSSSISGNSSPSKDYKCKLPTLKLKEFSGDLAEWLPFWSQFEKINQHDNLSPSDKLSNYVYVFQLTCQTCLPAHPFRFLAVRCSCYFSDL